MTIRRQKNINDALNALERALDQRELLLAKLVRLELKIRLLRKRSARAQKAYVQKGDDPMQAGAPRPYRFDVIDPGDEPNDEIPL